MADVADIENVLVSTLAQTIYPTGSGNPSIVSATCKIYRGWPLPKGLDADLTAGIINVSVFPQANEQKTTRYPRMWQELPVTTPALTLTASGNTVTVGGTPSSPLNAAVLVNGAAFVYPVQPTDTLTSIATALAALVNANTPATSIGPVITIPAAKQLAARIGAMGALVREIKRQKRGFQMTFWCPTPALRDAIVPPCDAVLADIEYLTLPDGTGGRIIYERTAISDRVENEGLYRRDLFYSVEYATTDTQAAAQIVTELFNLTGGLDPNAPPLKSFSI